LKGFLLVEELGTPELGPPLISDNGASVPLLVWALIRGY